MGVEQRTQQTGEHQPPEATGVLPSCPALVCAFPISIAVPLPPSSSAVVGRRTLREHGVTDGEVSSEHARIERRAGRYHVVDLGSRNGTFVDGQRIDIHQPTELVDGSLVRLGRSVFVFREQLVGSVSASPRLGEIVGPFGFREVARDLEAHVRRGTRVLLLEGETGTGKELLARHAADALGRGVPYAAVNVAAIAAGVFEAQLFGHVAGAYSDARTGSPGILVAHEGGTVFLDEIGCLSLPLQAKLLRLLEQREILAVGAPSPRTVDVALIAATNEALERRVAAGEFRADLLARLAVGRLELPPLRERTEDLPAIARHLASRAGISFDQEHVEIEAIERLMLHGWPRNVRELDGVLAKAAALDPRPGLRLWTVSQLLGPAPSPRPGTMNESLVARTLAECGGNETAAARRLGISRGKLRRFLARGSSP